MSVQLERIMKANPRGFELGITIFYAGTDDCALVYKDDQSELFVTERGEVSPLTENYLGQAVDGERVYGDREYFDLCSDTLGRTDFEEKGVEQILVLVHAVNALVAEPKSRMASRYVNYISQTVLEDVARIAQNTVGTRKEPKWSEMVYFSAEMYQQKLAHFATGIKS